MRRPSSSLLLAAARILTLSRLAGIIPFLWLLIQTHRVGSEAWGRILILFYCFMVLSDLWDGALARRAGAPSFHWGRLDAIADIAFNTLSLSVAAWLGIIGPWVPAGVAVLGGRFILRIRPEPAKNEQLLAEDRIGKIAGVAYYILVGVVVLELSVEGGAGRWAVARAGDVVFLYTLFALLHKRGRVI